MEWGRSYGKGLKVGPSPVHLGTTRGLGSRVNRWGSIPVVSLKGLGLLMEILVSEPVSSLLKQVTQN